MIKSLCKSLSIPLLLCMMAGQVYAGHSGRVFYDKNTNGVFDKGDTPVKNVVVSDGLNVVKTDRDGAFTLTGHKKERFIFITTPSGYKCEKYFSPVTEDFHNFALQSYRGVKQDGSHQFVQISDTEIFNTTDHEDWVENLKDYAFNQNIAFIVHTGDICYEKGLKAHRGLLNTGNVNCPVYYCIGNHDLVAGKSGEALFESIYGPTWYSFDVGNVHYVVTPMLYGDHKAGYTKKEVGAWLKNDLAMVPRERAVVVFNHDLLTDGAEFIYAAGTDEQVNLNEHNLKAWLYGHWHINYMRKQGDVYAISTASLDKGGIDHSTTAFRVMHVSPKGDVRSELRYSYIDKALKIVAPAEGQCPVKTSGAVPVVVNLYHTASPVKDVFCSFYSGHKQIAVVKLGKQTDWSWGTEWKPGEEYNDKRIEVRCEAIFENGEKVTARTSFVYRLNVKPVIELSGDWNNMAGNPQHTGLGGSMLDVPLEMAWITNVGANVYMSSPLVNNGKIFIASVDENLTGEGYVYALDGKTGEQDWKYKVRNSIKNSIAVEGGCVLAQDAEGWLYAIDTGTGKLVWEKKLQVNSLPALIEGLVAADGIVYAGTGAGLTAVKVADGQTLWVNKDWRQGEGTTTTLALGNGILVGGAQWQGLYGHDAVTGKQLWKIDENGLRDRGASAAIHGGLLYIISGKSFFILESETGKVVVRKELPVGVDVTSTPLLTDKEIVFGTSASGLIALDRQTLNEKWRFRTGDALIYTAPYIRKEASTIETTPVLTGDTIWFGASDGCIYGVESGSGRKVWQFDAGAPVFSSIAVVGNALIGSDFSGNVYLFSGK